MRIRVSRSGRRVLDRLVASSLCLRGTDSGGIGGAAYISDLVREFPGRAAVAQASVSRTLRRLQGAGLLELFNQYGRSLTERRAGFDAEVQVAERDPIAAFARARAAGGFFAFATPTEYLEYLRKSAVLNKRGLPMAIAQITPAGRQRLTGGRFVVNRKAKSSCQADAR